MTCSRAGSSLNQPSLLYVLFPSYDLFSSKSSPGSVFWNYVFPQPQWPDHSVIHHGFSLRWAQDVSILPHNQPVLAPWDDTSNQSRLALKPVFSHFPVRDLIARDARAAAGAPCLPLPGAGLRQEWIMERAVRPWAKGWNSSLGIDLDYIMLLMPPVTLGTSVTKDSWKPVPAAGTGGCWPFRGYMQRRCLTPCHCPGRGNAAFSSSVLFYPILPNFRNLNIYIHGYSFSRLSLLQKLPMCQVHLWPLITIWERGQEQSGRKFCKWKPEKMGREARFKLALGRGKCCWCSNTLLKSQEPGEHSEHIPAEHPPTQSSTQRRATTSPCQTPFSFHSYPSRVPKMSHFPRSQQCPTNHWGLIACCSSAYLNLDTNSIFSRICTDGKQQICTQNMFVF